MAIDITYETPVVEVIMVEVEKGFSISQEGTDPNANLPGDDLWG